MEWAPEEWLFFDEWLLEVFLEGFYESRRVYCGGIHHNLLGKG